MNIFIIIVATVIIGSLVWAIAFLCLTNPRQNKKFRDEEIALSATLKENELIRAGRSCFTCKHALKPHPRAYMVACFLHPQETTRLQGLDDWCFAYQPQVESAK